MTSVEILGANRFETYTRTREGSRGIVVRDGMILLSHEINGNSTDKLRDAQTDINNFLIDK